VEVIVSNNLAYNVKELIIFFKKSQYRLQKAMVIFILFSSTLRQIS
jgi:hypothetical protein